MARRKTLLEVTPEQSRLHHVAVLLKTKNIVTVSELSSIIKVTPAQLEKIFGGHVFRNNNPSYVINQPAAKLAHYLFPSAPFPDDQLAAVMKGRDVTEADIAHIPVRPKAGLTPRPAPYGPDRPVFKLMGDKWALSKPGKT